MNDKHSINQRFIKSVEYIIFELKTENKSSIAEKIKISKSKFSEILNNRMSIGIENLASFVEVFSIDSNWILTGKGEMLLNSMRNSVSEPKELYTGSENELIASKNKIIALLEEQKKQLEEENRILREKNKNSA